MTESKKIYFILKDNKLEDDNSPKHILDCTTLVSLDFEKSKIRVDRQNEILEKKRSMGFFEKLFFDFDALLDTTKRWRICEVSSNIKKIDYESLCFVHKQTLEITQTKPSEKEMDNYIKFFLFHIYENGLSSI
jgi:hypothetical protein